MSAKKYFGAFCLYLNYLVHGIGVLVMSLNVHEFEVQWQTDAAGVSVVISSLGLGRLALLVLAGSLSDKYGRRPFVLLGTVTYLAFRRHRDRQSFWSKRLSQRGSFRSRSF